MQALAARKAENTMRNRPAKTRPDELPERCNALKDEVYRQMFRVEEGRAGADKELALALLRAWMLLDVGPQYGSHRKWLRAICPICVGLIESAGKLTRLCESGESCT